MRANRGHGLVSVKQAAALGGVSCQTVRTWIAHGRLRAVKTDMGYRLDLEALDRFLTMRRAASEAGIKIDTLRHWAAANDTDAAD